MEGEVVRVDEGGQAGGDGDRGDGVRVAPQHLNRDLEARQTAQPSRLKPRDLKFKSLNPINPSNKKTLLYQKDN